MSHGLKVLQWLRHVKGAARKRLRSPSISHRQMAKVFVPSDVQVVLYSVFSQLCEYTTSCKWAGITTNLGSIYIVLHLGNFQILLFIWIFLGEGLIKNTLCLRVVQVLQSCAVPLYRRNTQIYTAPTDGPFKRCPTLQDTTLCCHLLGV